MNLIVVENEQEIGAAAAQVVAAVAKQKPNAAMVLATGNSPMGAYQHLMNLHQAGNFDTSSLRIFQLDGYLGITKEDPRSLEGWLIRSVLEPWNIPAEHFVRLPEDTPDAARECDAYNTAVEQAGGFDLAVLGLGPNGHLGFNEPPSTPSSPTRVIDLTEESLVSNAKYWGGIDRVPRQAITAGLDILLQSWQILLVVSGAHKTDILRKTLVGPMTEAVPASYLQGHPNVVVVADKAAWPFETIEAGR